MIDPIHSLAFSMQANPGVYAILLGSGISRTAKIPTGWEVTLELVRKIAGLQGEDCEPSPSDWYKAKFGELPNYSKLLDAVAKTPSERQQLLRGYFDATSQEREEGAKQPTAAHKAIASLVARGFVKVIITTNFDRLMERALEDHGITPTVISSPDQLAGALPLIHTQSCVVKIHGDYLDTRIRNTPEELSSYPEEFNNLLDRIFDEFGLIVSGWSAEWDQALRSAILRAPSRRFSTFWSTRGAVSDAAFQLINHRAAQTISINDADSFFLTLDQLIQSLEAFSRPHPLSTEVAVASLKRYLSESKFRIQLADLVSDEVQRTIESIHGAQFSIPVAPPDSTTFTARIKAYEAASETIISMASIGGYWSEVSQHHIWGNAITRLSSVPIDRGNIDWLDLRRYPATLFLYSLGLSAVVSNRLELLTHILTSRIPLMNGEEKLSVQLLPPGCLFENGGEVARLLPGRDRAYVPLSDWLHDMLRQNMRPQISDDRQYDLIFDKLEILIALAYVFHVKREGLRAWAPIGSFGYRNQNRQRIMKEIEGAVSQTGSLSTCVSSHLFGKSPSECVETISKLNVFLCEPPYNHWGF